MRKVWEDNSKLYMKKDVEYIINYFLNIIQREIINENKVKITGLGTFIPYTTNSYIRKKSNGNVEEVSEARCVKFKPSKKIKGIKDLKEKKL